MRKYIAELIGSFILVFCGTGAIIIDHLTGAITHIGVSMTFGLTVLSMIYCFGDISGAHINPAVSIAFTISGRMEKRWLPGYLLSQLTGAILASLCLRFLFPDTDTLGETLARGTAMQSFLLELILSFILMLVIFNVSRGAKEKGITAGIAIASVVGLEAMFAGPICGASMNPARSLGPALVNNHWDNIWVYMTGPVAGMLCAWPVSLLMHRPESESNKEL